MPNTDHLDGAKILVTGPTGQVAEPLTLALAKDNDVWGAARFSDAAARERLEAAGVTCVTLDLAHGEFDALPNDFDYVLNLAVVRGGDEDWDRDLAANAEATGLLMAHCRDAKAFLQCSSTAVYQHQGPHHPLKETDPLGDNHRVMMPTYSISKITAEVTARLGARQWNLPTTIARLNVPYGDNGGWPAWHLEFMIHGAPIQLHPEQPNRFNPIHEDDIVDQLPRMLEIASVPATIVNWAGAPATIEEWCAYLGELTGLQPDFVVTEATIGSVTTDNTKLHELVGETRVDWRDGMRRMVAARHPELLKP
jgi:nucleoside-diphosphate-sugar epimerase